ncbi:MAG: type II toxin-antitoxin system RelE/ParE family toxin [Deltaproteobacteria bacterium]|nr:type II toxin-antitoxin system RelE/ParE family toxin [Deltaproteobacteria bacterium]
MNSGFRVLVTRRAERDIADLDPVARRRVQAALLDLEREPTARARKLTSSELGQYRVRVGDWRLVFDLEGRDVVVLRVGHRREIYRRG